MKTSAIRLLALSSSLAIAGAACAADPGQGQDSMGEQQAREALAAAGYTDIDDLEFDNGMWEADARRDGRSVDVRIDPRTGNIFPEDGRSALGEAEVRTRLEAAGYQRIRDVEFDDGMWTADAELEGVDYDLYLDPETAEVVSRERD